MSRFGFARCSNCQRLNIHGARCVCTPLVADPPIDCDCTGGNEQVIGPKCQARIQAVWRDAIQQSHAIAQHIKETRA